MKGGLIVAYNSKPVSTGFHIFSDALTGEKSNYQTGSIFEVSVNLEPIRKNYVESRLIIQKMDSYSMGGSQGREIVKPQLYQNLYSKVRVEIERRKAQGK